MLQFPFEEQIPYVRTWNTGVVRYHNNKKWYSIEGSTQRGTLLKLKHLLEQKFLCDIQVDLENYYLIIENAHYPLLMEQGESKIKVSVAI